MQKKASHVGADQLDALVSIKSKNEVIADIVALLQSPAKNVISALQSGGKPSTEFSRLLVNVPKRRRISEKRIISIYLVFKQLKIIQKMADLK